MKEFLQILRRFVPPYKKYLGLSVLFNILSAVLNIFSFAALIPILQILFQVDGGVQAETAPRLVKAGVDVLVSGSYVFKSTDPYATIHALKELH